MIQINRNKKDTHIVLIRVTTTTKVGSEYLCEGRNLMQYLFWSHTTRINISILTHFMWCIPHRDIIRVSFLSLLFLDELNSLSWRQESHCRKKTQKDVMYCRLYGLLDYIWSKRGLSLLSVWIRRMNGERVTTSRHHFWIVKLFTTHFNRFQNVKLFRSYKKY